MINRRIRAFKSFHPKPQLTNANALWVAFSLVHTILESSNEFHHLQKRMLHIALLRWLGSLNVDFFVRLSVVPTIDTVTVSAKRAALAGMLASVVAEGY